VTEENTINYSLTQVGTIQYVWSDITPSIEPHKRPIKKLMDSRLPWPTYMASKGLGRL